MNLDEALRVIYYAETGNRRRYMNAAMMLARIAEAARDYVRADTGNDASEHAFLLDMVQTVDVP